MENYYDPPAGRAVPPPLPSTERGKQSYSESGPDKNPSILTYFAGTKICATGCVFFIKFSHHNSLLVPVPVAAGSEACLCDRSFAGFTGSNPAGGMIVCLLCLLCVISWRSLFLADHSSRGVLPSAVCPMSAITKPRRGRPRPGIGSKRHKGEKKLY
jgi:hypothetical protein